MPADGPTSDYYNLDYSLIDVGNSKRENERDGEVRLETSTGLGFSGLCCSFLAHSNATLRAKVIDSREGGKGGLCWVGEWMKEGGMSGTV